MYFRAGYDPSQYDEVVRHHGCWLTSKAAWSWRLMAENSNAVCCPDIGMHLAGDRRAAAPP